jgi:hypothetical protein
MGVMRAVLAFTFLAFCPQLAFPCSVSSIPPAAELVRLAEVIVRARAQAVSPEPGRNSPGSLGASPSQIEFRVISVLKGTFRPEQITFNGRLVLRDEPNQGPVPYAAVRHSGDSSCFAVDYRQGAEYLLFLKRASHRAYAQPDQLTPYWAPLTPSNEQVFGSGDPWEKWVQEQLQDGRVRKKPGV